MTAKNNQHYFNAPDEDKSSRFCRCGKYLTDKVHIRSDKNKQKQALIDMMRGDEEIGLYDDNLKMNKKNIMKLKGSYDIRESGKYISIFEDEEGQEWEVEFEIWVDKDYIYEETGSFLTDVFVQAECLSPGFSIGERMEMEIAIEEYVENNFNL